MEKLVLLYKFGAGVRFTRCADRRPDRLKPARRRAPVESLGTFDTSISQGQQIGADYAEIISAVEKHGFFVFPTSQTKPSPT
jgi:hypothetical protein